ncbi:MAG: hypothetical protein NTW37_22585 [Proteobacteria bacterium]|nr:hypothetical protein [Pseudomonadota bacterium]
MQVERRVVGRVVVREHQGTPAGLHAVAVEVGACTAGEHHAGQVVVAEGDRALDRAGCNDDLARADLPEALARQVLGDRGAAADLLCHGRHVVVPDRGDLAAHQHAHARRRLQFSGDLMYPAGRLVAVDARVLAEQRAAHLGAFIGDDHARATACRCECGGQPGRAATADQHVAVGMTLRIAARVRHLWRTAEAGCAADELFAGLPARGRPHERLVVEARRQHA